MSTISPSSVVKQVLGAGGFQGLGQMVSFLGIIAYTNLAPKSVVGSYFLFFGLTRVLTFLGGAGTTVDLIRKLNQSSIPDEEFSTAFVFLGGVSTVLMVGVLLVGPIVDAYVGEGVATVLAVFIPVEMLALLYVSTLKGEQKNVTADFSVTGRKVAMYVGGTVALYVGIQPITAMVGGAVGSRILHLGYMVSATDTRVVTVPGLAEIVALLHDIGYPSIVSVGDLGQEWIDTLLIGVFLSQGAVATYEIAWRFSGVALILTNAVTSVLYPRLSEMIEDGDYERFRTFSKRAYLYTITPIIGLLAGGIVLGEQLLGILYGEPYAGAFLPFVVLLVARLFYSIRRIAVIVMYALKSDAKVARISVIAVLVNALLNVILIPIFGILGAAAGSVSSFVLLGVFTAWYVKHEAGFLPPFEEFGRVSVAAGIMFAAVYTLRPLTPPNTINVFILIGVGAGFYITLIPLVSRTARADFTKLIRSFTRPG